MSIDLDTVILADLAPLFGDPAHRPPVRVFRGKQQAYNTSLVMIRAGAAPEIWDDFEPQRAANLIDAERARNPSRPITGSDQAWLSLRLPGLPTWDASDGVLHLSEASPARLAGARLVFFSGDLKPWSRQAPRYWPAMAREWARYAADGYPLALPDPYTRTSGNL